MKKKTTKNPLTNYQVYEYVVIAECDHSPKEIINCIRPFLTTELRKLLAKPIKVEKYKKALIKADDKFLQKWKPKTSEFIESSVICDNDWDCKTCANPYGHIAQSDENDDKNDEDIGKDGYLVNYLRRKNNYFK